MPNPLRLAVVDDEPIVRRRLTQLLGRRYSVETFALGAPLLERLRQDPFDIVLLDVRLPDMSGLEVLPQVRELCPQCEVIIITGFASLDDAVQAVKQGAFYYLAKPFTPQQVELIVERAAEKARLAAENRELRHQVQVRVAFEGIVGISEAMKSLMEAAAKVWATDCNVLVAGESGTGKELLARAIHQNSPRAKGPFVSFNCGGFSDSLIAGELFGHEKGAFTGADTTRIGLLEAAQGGTLFLDEVGDMPASMQVKLLRVIQERQLYRVGSSKPVALDIRIISASNKELEQEVEQGRFRQDLYYRLKVVQLRVPALRERKEDIPILINYFLEKFNRAYRKNARGFAREALDLLMNYSFPGNVRELENIVSGAVALAGGELIRAEDIPADLESFEVQTLGTQELVSLEEQEKAYIARVLEATGGNRVMAARILGLPRTTLWRKIKKFGLETPGEEY
jgi:two-component system, NtrC family, response regulator AtoC